MDVVSPAGTLEASLSRINKRLAEAFGRVSVSAIASTVEVCLSGRKFLEIFLRHVDRDGSASAGLFNETTFDTIKRLNGSGSLPRLPAQWAHALRVIGNVASHAGDAEQDVTSEDATEVVELVGKLAGWLVTHSLGDVASHKQEAPQSDADCAAFKPALNSPETTKKIHSGPVSQSHGVNSFTVEHYDGERPTWISHFANAIIQSTPSHTFVKDPDVYLRALFKEVPAEAAARAAVEKVNLERVFITGEHAQAVVIPGRIIHYGYNMAGRDMFIRSCFSFSTWGREIVMISRDQSGISAWIQFIHIVYYIGETLSLRGLESLEMGIGPDDYKSRIFCDFSLSEPEVFKAMRTMLGFWSEVSGNSENMNAMREGMGQLEQQVHSIFHR
jgi:hypothetical protein